MKRFLVLVGALLLILAFSILLKNNSRIIGADLNRIVKGEETKELFQRQVNGFRLDLYHDSLYVIADTIISSFGLHQASKGNNFHADGIYNVGFRKDTMILFSENTQFLLYYINGQMIKKIRLANCDDTVVIGEDATYYCASSNHAFFPDYQIRCLERPDFSVEISDILNNTLQGIDSTCRSFYFEGRLYETKEEIVFMPYHMSILLVITKSDYKKRIVRTIEGPERVDLQVKKVSMPSGGLMYTCQSADDFSFIQFGAGQNEEHFVIQSDIRRVLNDNVVYYLDFYNKKTWSYDFSRQVSFPIDQQEQILSIKASKSSIYILTNRNNVWRLAI